MASVRAVAVRWVDDDFPGHVEVVLIDASGRNHPLLDKQPVFGDDRLTPHAEYPMVVRVDCDVLGPEVHGAVEVALRHGVESADGMARFVVAAEHVQR